MNFIVNRHACSAPVRTLFRVAVGWCCLWGYTACAQEEGNGNALSLEESLSQLAVLQEYLARELPRDERFLTLQDQVLRASVVMGAMDVAAADAALQARAQQVYDNSFTDADEQALLTQHGATVDQLIANVEARVAEAERDTRRWPPDRATNIYSVQSHAALTDLRALRQSGTNAPADYENALCRVGEAATWTTGRDLDSDKTLFNGSAQRVRSMMPNPGLAAGVDQLLAAMRSPGTPAETGPGSPQAVLGLRSIQSNPDASPDRGDSPLVSVTPTSRGSSPHYFWLTVPIALIIMRLFRGKPAKPAPAPAVVAPSPYVPPKLAPSPSVPAPSVSANPYSGNLVIGPQSKKAAPSPASAPPPADAAKPAGRLTINMKKNKE